MRKTRWIPGVLAVIALAACSAGTGTNAAFPGDAHARAVEVARRADVLGVRHADVGTLEKLNGVDGKSSCDYKSKKDRLAIQAESEALSQWYDPALDNIIVSVYCPRLA
jgi:hypothetical protein